MKNRLALFILGLLIWALLTWPMDFQNIAVGIAVSGLVALLTGDMFVLNKKRSKPFSKYLWLCYYAVLLFWECVKANIDLASRILGPKIRINPGIVKVKTALRSDTGLTFLANAITLSAGTFCVDIDAQNGILYIHWIDVSSQDIDRATQLICGRFEMVLKNIFE